MSEKKSANKVGELKRSGGRIETFDINQGAHTLAFDLEIMEKRAIKEALKLIFEQGDQLKSPLVRAEFAAYLLGYLQLDPMEIIREIGLEITREVLGRSKHYEELREKQ